MRNPHVRHVFNQDLSVTPRVMTSSFPCCNSSPTKIFIGAKVQRIDRKSSIENEPRTLHFHQIQWAREAAMFVMNNAKNLEEALSIFTEGLEPIVSLGQKNGDRGGMDTIENYESLGNEPNDIRLSVIRDIASAP